MKNTMSSLSAKPALKTAPELDVIAILKELPEVHLRIFDIARKAVKPDGTVDADRLIKDYKEVREAANEAESYAVDTSSAVAFLRFLLRGSY